MSRSGATVDELASAVYVDVEDIRYYLTTFVDLDSEDVPFDIIDDLHNAFDPLCIRSVPGYYGATGDDI